jgi:hydroxymethylbilane synthase
MAAISARANPHDALCSDGRRLDGLPQGARLGTSSLRRQCQLLARRPDLRVSMLRGNVPTRLGKLDAGDFDAIVLAAAGLERLGLANRISEQLSDEVCLPAVGQGVLGIETRAPAADAGTTELDTELIGVIRGALHDEAEAQRVSAERTFLARLGGSCRTPLAAYAVHRDGALWVRGLCGTPDGARVLRADATGAADRAAALGRDVAEALLDQGAQAIIDACTA